MHYREKAIRIGKATPLLGILTEPAPQVPALGHGVVMLNAGLLHRVGPSRLHVQVARRLAGLGYHCLRFDFSGIGDSDARRDGLIFEQSCVAEVRDAIDFLAGKGTASITLLGLCSGADAAFLTAVEDPRVVALVQLDPWIYHTWRYKWIHSLHKARDLKSWKNLLTGETLQRRVLRPLLSRPASAPTSEAADENVVIAHYSRDFPPKDLVVQQLRVLLDRKVRMLNIFSGGMSQHVAYEGQYKDCFRMLDFGGLLTERYDRSAEHTFSAIRHQAWIVELVAGWMKERSTVGERVEALRHALAS